MIVGVPREIKIHEYRVGLVPSGVREVVRAGHKVMLERHAGEGIVILDEEYVEGGAEILETADDVYAKAEMIVKVKEPLPQERLCFKESQLLFCYLHLAADIELTQSLLDRRVIGIAYETVQSDDGRLPLLVPMSEVAGRLSVQVGAHYLEKKNGGSGVLLGGVTGTNPGNVAIVGAGVVGTNAAKIALGMGANVTLLDINVDRLRYLNEIFSGNLITLIANTRSIEEAVVNADLVVGAVLIPGAKAPKVVTRDMISKMRQGSVVVDVGIDQGGCIEGSHPTTFDDPVFTIDGVIYYCVANIPGAVARTSTFALTSVTFPYVLKLANLGFREAMKSDEPLKKGLNVFEGKVTNGFVAESLGIEYTPYTT